MDKIDARLLASEQAAAKRRQQEINDELDRAIIDTAKTSPWYQRQLNDGDPDDPRR